MTGSLAARLDSSFRESEGCCLAKTRSADPKATDPAKAEARKSRRVRVIPLLSQAFSSLPEHLNCKSQSVTQRFISLKRESAKQTGPIGTNHRSNPQVCRLGSGLHHRHRDGSAPFSACLFSAYLTLFSGLPVFTPHTLLAH